MSILNFRFWSFFCLNKTGSVFLQTFKHSQVHFHSRLNIYSMIFVTYSFIQRRPHLCFVSLSRILLLFVFKVFCTFQLCPEASFCILGSSIKPITLRYCDFFSTITLTLLSFLHIFTFHIHKKCQIGVVWILNFFQRCEKFLEGTKLKLTTFSARLDFKFCQFCLLLLWFEFFPNFPAWMWGMNCRNIFQTIQWKTSGHSSGWKTIGRIKIPKQHTFFWKF